MSALGVLWVLHTAWRTACHKPTVPQLRLELPKASSAGPLAHMLCLIPPALQPHAGGQRQAVFPR